MSQAVGALDITIVTGAASLATAQYHFVTLDANGKAVIGSTGGMTIGILQNTPAVGEAARVRVLGTSKLVMSTTINEGDLLKSAAGAGVIVAAAKDFIGAIALEASLAPSDIIEVLIIHCIYAGA